MTEPKQLIAVIEDDPDIAGVLEYNLKNAGFDVAVAATATAGLDIVRSRGPALVLLDVMLPDEEGTEVCRRLKNDPLTAQIPIVMATAKGEEIDRVVGFELGVDDYITKPFSVRELVLRVKAILKRNTAPTSQSVQRAGPIAVDLEAHRVSVEGRDVALTALEFRLLYVLVSRRERVQSRETLLRDVWGMEINVESRTVDTHVKRLREKLGSAGALIETVRGVGYRVTLHPQPAGDAMS